MVGSVREGCHVLRRQLIAVPGDCQDATAPGRSLSARRPGLAGRRRPWATPRVPGREWAASATCSESRQLGHARRCDGTSCGRIPSQLSRRGGSHSLTVPSRAAAREQRAGPLNSAAQRATRITTARNLATRHTEWQHMNGLGSLVILWRDAAPGPTTPAAAATATSRRLDGQPAHRTAFAAWMRGMPFCGN